jgi:hypothetical protein
MPKPRHHVVERSRGLESRLRPSSTHRNRRIIKAEAELEASLKLKEAAGAIMENPAGLELRRMQMITEVGAEQNTTTIIMMPSEFVSAAGAIAEWTRKTAGGKRD